MLGRAYDGACLSIWLWASPAHFFAHSRFAFCIGLDPSRPLTSPHLKTAGRRVWGGWAADRRDATCPYAALSASDEYENSKFFILKRQNSMQPLGWINCPLVSFGFVIAKYKERRRWSACSRVAGKCYVTRTWYISEVRLPSNIENRG
jgi:hypothetical protein